MMEGLRSAVAKTKANEDDDGGFQAFRREVAIPVLPLHLSMGVIGLCIPVLIATLAMGWCTASASFHFLLRRLVLVLILFIIRQAMPDREVLFGRCFLIISLLFALEQLLSSRWSGAGQGDSLNSEVACAVARHAVFLACAYFVSLDISYLALVGVVTLSSLAASLLFMGIPYDSHGFIQVVVSLCIVSLLLLLGAHRRDKEMRGIFAHVRRQQDSLVAAFDACCIVDPRSTVVLASTPELDNLLQCGMQGEKLASVASKGSCLEELLEAFQGPVHSTPQGGEVGKARLTTCLTPASGVSSDAFEVSIFASTSVTTLAGKQQKPGIFLGLQKCPQAAIPAGLEKPKPGRRSEAPSDDDSSNTRPEVCDTTAGGRCTAWSHEAADSSSSCTFEDDDSLYFGLGRFPPPNLVAASAKATRRLAGSDLSEPSSILLSADLRASSQGMWSAAQYTFSELWSESDYDSSDEAMSSPRVPTGIGCQFIRTLEHLGHKDPTQPPCGIISLRDATPEMLRHFAIQAPPPATWNM